MDVPVQAESKFALSVPFCFIHALKELDNAHLTLVRVIFTQSPDSNANLFQKHPHRQK